MPSHKDGQKFRHEQVPGVGRNDLRYIFIYNRMKNNGRGGEGRGDRPKAPRTHVCEHNRLEMENVNFQGAVGVKGVQKQPCWGGTRWEAATVARGEPGVTRRKSPETRHARRCRADLSLRPCRLSPRVGSLQSRPVVGAFTDTRACEDGAQDRPAVGGGGDSGADEGSARSGQTQIPWAMGGPCASVQTASFCHVPLQDHIRADRTPEIRPSTFYLFVFF